MDAHDDLAAKLETRIAKHDPAKAEAALDALAEYLVSVWLRRQERQQTQAGPALPEE